MECYVIVVNGVNVRFFFENEMLFGGVEKIWFFCDVEKSDRLFGVLKVCDEVLFGSIIINGFFFVGVIDL